MKYRIWILDKDHMHVATLTGPRQKVSSYAKAFYPEIEYKHDTIGPNCANADFDYNPDAKVIES